MEKIEKSESYVSREQGPTERMARNWYRGNQRVSVPKRYPIFVFLKFYNVFGIILFLLFLLCTIFEVFEMFLYFCGFINFFNIF